jgi:prepilin-type N-terminal cleavage/methylation domain-containing protein
MTSRRAVHRGFTLIELMLVVAIVGVLSTIALPVAQSALLRTRAAERLVAVKTIKRGIDDLFVMRGGLPPAYGGTMEGAATPALPPTPGRRVPDWNQPGWNEIFAASGGVGPDLQGSLYYTYQFVAVEEAGRTYYDILTFGDLDGDGVQSIRTAHWERTGGNFTSNDADQVPTAWLSRAFEDGIW